jgi:hypothetical protein
MMNSNTTFCTRKKIAGSLYTKEPAIFLTGKPHLYLDKQGFDL